MTENAILLRNIVIYIISHSASLRSYQKKKIMGLYTPVTEMLDEVIHSYREEFQQANQTVSVDGFLDNYEMNHLLKSNSKVQAALKVRAVLTSAEKTDKSNLCRLVESWMNDAIRTGNYSVAHLYENVLKTLNQVVE